jgi:hypothetical protein
MGLYQRNSSDGINTDCGNILAILGISRIAIRTWQAYYLTLTYGLGKEIA